MSVSRSILVTISWLCIAIQGVNISYAGTGRVTVAGAPSVGGIQLGMTAAELKSLHPTLYVQRLSGGEILHEACNQRTLQAFTFAEQPWSPGEIGEVSVREVVESVCRDETETGKLPDLHLPPATDRNVKIGDSEQAVVKQYGRPDERTEVGSGKIRLRYHLSEKRKGLLVFILAGNRVTSISAAYMPPESWRAPGH